MSDKMKTDSTIGNLQAEEQKLDLEVLQNYVQYLETSLLLKLNVLDRQNKAILQLLKDNLTTLPQAEPTKGT